MQAKRITFDMILLAVDKCLRLVTQFPTTLDVDAPSAGGVKLKLEATETDLVEFSPDERFEREVSGDAIHSQPSAQLLFELHTWRNLSRSGFPERQGVRARNDGYIRERGLRRSVCNALPEVSPKGAYPRS